MCVGYTKTVNMCNWKLESIRGFISTAWIILCVFYVRTTSAQADVFRVGK